MTDEQAMALALAEARLAVDHGDVPVGAVLVNSAGEVLAQRHNEREHRHDAVAHAELLTLSDACQAAGSWRLNDTTLYVTLEPCVMCAGALLSARVRRLVFAAADPKAGATGSLYNVCVDPRLNHEVVVEAGVLATEASALLSGFFSQRRSGA